ncbi:MAG: type II secretion system F family protein, partial [Candidatus Nanohaloarchaea archaeon]|nr:type II secretion system F family protein [Candidatus Nanohaloarchaea archaeon]
GFNFYNHAQQTHIYTKSIEAGIDPRLMTVRNNQPVEIGIPLRNPDRLSNIQIKVTFDKVRASSSITMRLNGETLVEGQTGYRPGRSQVLTPETSILRPGFNKLVISGSFTLTSSARIRSVTVTGYSSFQRIIFLVLNLIGILITLGPILAKKYYEYTVRSELEERFPDFLRDVVEGTRSGMSLPQAIQNAQGNDYGRLSEHVNALSAKLEWGIPFDKVLWNFAEETRSPIIKRAVNTINQTYESGGNVSQVLDTVGNNLKEIKKLRKERESELYGEMVTGYVVYFIFLLVLIGLIRYLVPSLSFTGNIGPLGGGGQSAEELIATYRPIFQNLVIIQSIFSGLVIGKLSEGKLRAGAKHSAILLAVGYTAAILFM